MESVVLWLTERKHRLFVIIQLLGVVVALLFLTLAFFLRWLPSPGIAVAIIAVVAAAMSIHADMRGSHKAVWMLIIGAFAIIELLAIANERNIQARQQQRALESEHQHFREVGRGIETAIANGDRQFQETINKENSILDRTRAVAGLARRNLESLSGEGSVPCIVPQGASVHSGVVPMVVWNKGTNNLTGVQVRVLSETEEVDGVSMFYKPAADLGTLRPEWPKPLPEGFSPVLREHGIPAQSADDVYARYIAEIWTQNGYYTEVINFRHGKSDPQQPFLYEPWSYQYWLLKHISFEQKNHSRRGMKAQIIKECSQFAWSDDLRRAAKPIIE